MGIEVCEWISGISGLKYKKAAQDGDAIMGYVDADYVGNVDIGKPLSGYVFTMFGTAICWKANLQPVVALSTTKSKYIALVKGVKEALWLKGMIGELGIVQNCVTIHYDSRSFIHLANHHIYHERMKHITVRLHFIRDVVESEDNPTDVFTKSLPRSKFKHCLDLINFSRSIVSEAREQHYGGRNRLSNIWSQGGEFLYVTQTLLFSLMDVWFDEDCLL